MSTKKILKLIYTIIIVIELLIITILYMKKPLNEEYIVYYLPIFKKAMPIIVLLFILSIIIYVIENKINNKNEEELDEYNIQPNFDIELKNKDILYLSAVFNKQQPGKKEIVLLIMQLINKKVIDLSCYSKGDKYQYILEKRNLQFTNISSAEQELIDYLFENSNRVDLMKKVNEIYYKNDSDNIVKKCKEYLENLVEIKKSSIKIIYQIITSIIAVVAIYLGFISMFVLEMFTQNQSYSSSISVICKYVLSSIIGIIIGFFITIKLKKINKTYKYDNDSYLYICRNLIFFNLLILISFMFKSYFLIQFIITITYIFIILTIMIMYNVHICLSKKDIETREKLFSLREYFKENKYLEDKEFGNIITYEECMMYGFLFNITVKINDEFDILQKQLYDSLKTEGKLYIKLFQSNIVK